MIPGSAKSNERGLTKRKTPLVEIRSQEDMENAQVRSSGAGRGYYLDAGSVSLVAGSMFVFLLSAIYFDLRLSCFLVVCFFLLASFILHTISNSFDFEIPFRTLWGVGRVILLLYRGAEI